MAHDVEMIDFHTHHVPARFEVTAGKTATANQRARWEMLARKLADEDLLLTDIRAGDVGARVVNIPAQLIADADGRVPRETIMAMNDHLAALVARHPGRIYGLASVDAYEAKNPPARPSAPCANSGCAACSSTVHAATA